MSDSPTHSRQGREGGRNLASPRRALGAYVSGVGGRLWDGADHLLAADGRHHGSRSPKPQAGLSDSWRHGRWQGGWPCVASQISLMTLF